MDKEPLDKEPSGADRRRYPRFHINQSIKVSIGREKFLYVSAQKYKRGRPSLRMR